MMCAIKKAGVGEADRSDDSAEPSRAGRQGDSVRCEFLLFCSGPTPGERLERKAMKKNYFCIALSALLLALSCPAQAAQKELQKLTVGYTPIAGAALPLLEAGGVKPNEVVFIQNGGVGESYAALAGGRVDVCMIGYPFGLNAKNAGFNLLFRPSQTEYGLFPTAVIAARESWLRDAKNRKVAVDFLRALHEGQQLARENAAVTKRALRKFTRVDDDALLQGSFEYYRDAFPSSLRVIEKAMANALKFVDHPKAKQADIKQSFDNTYVDEAMKQ